MDSEPSWERVASGAAALINASAPVVSPWARCRKCHRNEQSPRACAKPGFLQPADRLCQRTWRMRACRGRALTKRGAGPAGGCRHSWSSSPRESAIRRSFRAAPLRATAENTSAVATPSCLVSGTPTLLVCRWRLADAREGVTCPSQPSRLHQAHSVPVLRRPT